MYKEMLAYVEKTLMEGNGNNSKNPLQTFRTRFEHIKRVYVWVNRLLPDFPNVDEKVVKTAACFHDVGYAGVGYKKNHNIKGVTIFKEYAQVMNYDQDFIDKVTFCIMNHCDKDALKSSIANDELKLLIEADLLDEEGALGIAFDLMVTGATAPRNYSQGYQMILNHTCHVYDQEYMITPLAKKYWDAKRELVKNFMTAYEEDLCRVDIED